MQKKRFIEVVPQIANVPFVQLYIAPEVIALVVALAQNRRTTVVGGDRKEVYGDLMNYVGSGLITPTAIKLAATLALFCQKLADGRNQKRIHAYLNYRIWKAQFYTGKLGRELLAEVTEAVQRDLDRCLNLPVRQRR